MRISDQQLDALLAEARKHPRNRAYLEINFEDRLFMRLRQEEKQFGIYEFFRKAVPTILTAVILAVGVLSLVSRRTHHDVRMLEFYALFEEYSEILSFESGDVFTPTNAWMFDALE